MGSGQGCEHPIADAVLLREEAFTPPVAGFDFVRENGLRYGELRRAVVERRRDRTLLMTSDQKTGRFQTTVYKRKQVLSASRSTVFLEFLGEEYERISG